MKQLAADIEQLSGFPPNVVNTFFADGFLFDAGTRTDRRSILKQLAGRKVEAHAITHAHPDHQGASLAVHQTLGAPVFCGENDAEAVESGRLSLSMPASLGSKLSAWAMAGPACPVARRLKEGDRVGRFVVLDMPGHSPGHVAYWRELDGVLILGDVLTNINVFTTLPGLHLPPGFFTVDPAQNRRSAKRLLDLGIKPSLVCFGHGPPLRDTERFVDFLTKLSD